MALSKRLFKQTVAVACASFGLSLVSHVYHFYYIKVFLEVYQIKPAYLSFAKVVFMIWEALSSPLIGCIQDVGCGGSGRWLRNRRLVVLFLGSGCSMAFLLFWFPWTSNPSDQLLIAAQLAFSLFFYGLLFNFAQSAHSGLYTELSTNHVDRVRVVFYMEIFRLCASLAIFPLDKLSNNLQNIRAFQYLTVAFAILSALSFIYTGLCAPRNVAQVEKKMELLTKEGDEKDKQNLFSSVDKEGGDVKRNNLKKSAMTGARTSWQIIRNRDFLCVVLANSFRLMRITLASGFTAIFVEALISPNGLLPLGSMQLSLFYQITQTVPKLVFMFLWPLLERYGPWAVNYGQLGISLVVCVVTFFVGRQHIYWMAAFFMIENILCRSARQLYSVFLPDLVDQDMDKHGRKSPMSTMLFSLKGVFTKPAMSLSPVIVVALLGTANFADYNRMKRATGGGGRANNETMMSMNGTVDGRVFMSPTELSALYDVMFSVACLFPLCCILLEALSLAPYRLKNRHRQWGKKKPSIVRQADAEAVSVVLIAEKQ